MTSKLYYHAFMLDDLTQLQHLEKECKTKEANLINHPKNLIKMIKNN